MQMLNKIERFRDQWLVGFFLYNKKHKKSLQI
ncbi:hypothetical protein EZJ58_2867 [Sodalis ligni]|uniref:Uncharacterized protein n=1 Tax=Sodalis ligni TaxID=2697027 RepID=A0A4R1NG49_9GAMM|nr:hypothetical protein EZJ58_2867 [Sodalis ligni]